MSDLFIIEAKIKSIITFVIVGANEDIFLLWVHCESVSVEMKSGDEINDCKNPDLHQLTDLDSTDCAKMLAIYELPR